MNALDTMAQDLEAVRRERDDYREAFNNWRGIADTLMHEGTAERERADAMAALVQEMTDTAIQEGAGTKMRMLIDCDAGPSASLARRDARIGEEARRQVAQEWELGLSQIIAEKQAEALESLHAAAAGYVSISRGALIDEARRIRRKAEGCES